MSDMDLVFNPVLKLNTSVRCSFTFNGNHVCYVDVDLRTKEIEDVPDDK